MEGGPHEPITAQPAETFPKIVGPIIQRAMQRGWELVQEGVDGAKLFRDDRQRALSVQAIVSAARELDGRPWVHLSVSVIHGTPKSVLLPRWSTLVWARDEFLGPAAKCLLVIPPHDEHVNIAEVHHLWHCPEGDGLPDFTRGSGSL